MIEHRSSGTIADKIVGTFEIVFGILIWLLEFFIWKPIVFIFKLLCQFVKDVFVGVYGKFVQATVVVIFGAIVYYFQSHLR